MSHTSWRHILNIQPLLVQILCGSLSKCLPQIPSHAILGHMANPCPNTMWLIVWMLTTACTDTKPRNSWTYSHSLSKYYVAHCPNAYHKYQATHILDIWPILVQILCGSLSECLPQIPSHTYLGHTATPCPNTMWLIVQMLTTDTKPHILNIKPPCPNTMWFYVAQIFSHIWSHAIS